MSRSLTKGDWNDRLTYFTEIAVEKESEIEDLTNTASIRWTRSITLESGGLRTLFNFSQPDKYNC